MTGYHNCLLPLPNVHIFGQSFYRKYNSLRVHRAQKKTRFSISHVIFFQKKKSKPPFLVRATNPCNNPSKRHCVWRLHRQEQRWLPFLVDTSWQHHPHLPEASPWIQGEDCGSFWRICLDNVRCMKCQCHTCINQTSTVFFGLCTCPPMKKQVHVSLESLKSTKKS